MNESKQIDSLPSFEQLFEGNRKILQTESEYFSTLTQHPGEKGLLNESHLRKLIARYLPKKFGIGTGFVVSSKTFPERRFKQLDLIIYDALNNAPLYQSEAFGIFPIEMVYGYIEVKTTLRNADLEKAFATNKEIRALQHDKHYLFGHVNTLAPRFYMFAYRSEIASDQLGVSILKKFLNEPEAHCHGAYVLSFDKLIQRAALGSADALALIQYESPALSVFLTNLSAHFDSMIARRAEGAGDFTLPMADMKSYFQGKRHVVKVDT